MLDKDRQFESAPTDAEATVHLPWDIIQPPEAEGVNAASADALSQEVDSTGSPELAAETSDPQPPTLESPVVEAAEEPALQAAIAPEHQDPDPELSALDAQDSAPQPEVTPPTETSDPEPDTALLVELEAQAPDEAEAADAAPQPTNSDLPADVQAEPATSNLDAASPDTPPQANPKGLVRISLPVLSDDAIEPQDQPLPWSVAPAADIVDTPIDPSPADPQPPALAYAPAFLAVDDEGLPIPDEVVDQLDVEIPSLPPEPLEPEDLTTSSEPITPAGSGLWTIPLMCVGIAIIACCLLIPQADKNRRLAWEREGLRRNLEQLQQQVETNEKFLEALATDKFLAKRLAQRQLNVVPAGTTVLELDGITGTNSSPFQLVTIPPPPPLPEYQPIGGRFAAMCRDPQTQLYLMGCGLFALAAGLVLGRDRAPTD